MTNRIIVLKRHYNNKIENIKRKIIRTMLMHLILKLDHRIIHHKTIQLMFHCLFVIYMNLITKCFHKIVSVLCSPSFSPAIAQRYFSHLTFPPKQLQSKFVHMFVVVVVVGYMKIQQSLYLRIVSINQYYSKNIQWYMIKDMRSSHKSYSKIFQCEKKIFSNPMS